MHRDADRVGQPQSPAGFEFGLQGWTPPQQVVHTITFFLNGTAMVCDQTGKPIRGAELPGGKPVFFATSPPVNPDDDKKPGYRRTVSGNGSVTWAKLATHAEVVAALGEERVDWQDLTWAGWPQLPYAKLKELRKLPPTPAEELAKIPDPELRRDALRARREADEAAEAMLRATEVATAE